MDRDRPIFAPKAENLSEREIRREGDGEFCLSVRSVMADDGMWRQMCWMWGTFLRMERGF